MDEGETASKNRIVRLMAADGFFGLSVFTILVI